MSESESLEERLAAIRVGVNEIRAELERRSVDCERRHCNHKAVGPFVVGKYVVLLCESDIADLSGSNNTWKNHMKQLIMRDCERRFMESQVPVYIAPEDRVARDPSTAEEEPKSDR